MKTTSKFEVGRIIDNVATQATINTLKGVYYTSFFFEEGKFLSHAQLRPVKGEINALEAATTDPEADKAMKLLKKAAEAGLKEVIFAAMGQAFFTLSLGIGAIAIFGSYIGKERTDRKRNSPLLPFH